MNYFLNFFTRHFTCSSLEEAVCNPRRCRVLEMQLFDTNLADKGSDFSKLKNIRKLDIQGNINLFCLPEFDLPPSIGQLNKLKSLTLLNIPIKTFPAWIENLHNLEYLMVRGTDATIIPEFISSLKKLKTLRVENCELAELPKSLKSMDHLKRLGLCDTRLTNLSTELFPKNLKYLNFSGTGCYNPADLNKLHIELPNTKIYPPTILERKP